MTFDDKCALSCYAQIAALDEEHNVYIVQHKKTGNIYVKKTLTVFNPEIYEYLRNNHICGIPDVIETAEDNGNLIIIEEYISGQTLRSLMDSGTVLSESQAVDMTGKLCRIVQRLHSTSPAIIHRDIKPSNIIVTPDGNIMLIDMNAAKYSRNTGARDTALLGTVGYAAPEQYGFGTSGTQADIYSIGVLLNELLTGVPPTVTTAPGEPGKIIRKCTMMDPKDRYASVDELIKDLDALPDSGPGPYSAGHGRFLPPGFRSGNPMHMAVAIIGYAMLICVGGTMTVTGVKSEAAVWLERIFSIICGLSTVLISCNYLDIWSILNLDKIKNVWLKTLAIIIADIAAFVSLFVIMLVIESGM